MSNCLDCGVCESCIDRSISLAEEMSQEEKVREIHTLRAESQRLRAGLEMLAQCRHISGNAQRHMRTQLLTIDAILAGADVRDIATVVAIAAGTWKPDAATASARG